MNFLNVLLQQLLVLVISCAALVSNADGNRPNILLILTDDQGWSTLGCYGGEKVATPHLDRLAAEGIRFTDAYVTSQCSPTRASLMTGQYTARHGLWHVLPWYGYPYARVSEPAFAENFPRSTFTIAKGLKAAGYRTAIVGKWHLTANDDGHYNGINPDASHYYGFDYAPPPLGKESFQPGQDRGVEKLTTQAIDFISRNKDQPWFCYLSHHMIHGKVVAPDDITRKYQELGFKDEGPNRAVYLAGLECIDRSIGRLMSSLKELGEDKETLVLFLSDNGGIDRKLAFKDLPKPHPTSPQFATELVEYDNAPLREGKGSVYEGGVRVPFIAWYPKKIASGKVVSDPTHVVDMLPTCFDFANASAPAEYVFDGVSLAPLMLGKRDVESSNRAIFQYYPFYDLRWGLVPSASIRMGGYKLIEFFGDRVDSEAVYHSGASVELYDLKADIGETQDLSKTHPELALELKQKLRNWIAEVGATPPTRNPHFDPGRAFFETREKPEFAD